MKKMSRVQRILGASAFALRLRKFAIAALAAATVAVGSLATIPTASALPQCTVNVGTRRCLHRPRQFLYQPRLLPKGLDYSEMALDLLTAPCD